MAKGIRSYGPGKFSTILDSYMYDLSLDGVDEEVGSVDEGGWYGFLEIDQAAIDRIREEGVDGLTKEEEDLLAASAAVVLFERTDGVVEVEWYDSMQEAEDAWSEIEEEFEGEEEGG